MLPEHGRVDALCELNVIEQVLNVAYTTVMQDAWSRGQNVTLHGWIYGLQDGLLQNLHMTVSGNDELEALYAKALSGVRLMPRHPA
jgi:carbonic anhydrase